MTCLAPRATATGLYSRTAVPVAKAVQYRVMTDPARVGAEGLTSDRVTKSGCRRALLFSRRDSMHFHPWLLSGRDAG